MRRLAVQSVALVLVLALPGVFCLMGCESSHAPPKPVDGAKLVEEASWGLHNAFTGGSAEEQEAQLRRLFATEEEFTYVFGAAGATYYPKYSEFLEALCANLERAKEELSRHGTTTSLTAEELTTANAPHVEALVGLMPSDLRIYRVMKKTGTGSGSSSVYFVRDGRCFWISGADRIAMEIAAGK